MAKDNLFSKEHLKTIDIEKRDWMAELAIPPQVADFLRQNKKRIQAGAIALVVLLLAWTGLQYYLDNRREKSTAMLAEAMAIEAVTDKVAALERVVDEYGGTDAGVWARIELGHLAYDQGDYDKAIAMYDEAMEELGTDSTVAPFVEYAIATAYERKGDFSAALDHYRFLVDRPGFEGQGQLGIARCLEAEGKRQEAAAAYEKVLSYEDQAADDSWIREKIRQLRAATDTEEPAAADTATQSESGGAAATE